MQIRALIIDDDRSIRETVREHVSKLHPTIKLVGEAGSGTEAIAAVHAERPDLLFLDVQLGDMSGFDVLMGIKPRTPEVVFITAFDHYAAKAFEVNAIDYVCKPFGAAQLSKAVGRALERISTHARQEGMEALVGTMVSDDQIALPDSTGVVVLHYDDILYCLNLDKNTRVVLRQKEAKQPLISRPLRAIAPLLEEHGFVRINQSCLINLKHVRRYVRGEGGDVVMSDGNELSVSRELKPHLMEALKRISIA